MQFAPPGFDANSLAQLIPPLSIRDMQPSQPSTQPSQSPTFQPPPPSSPPPPQPTGTPPPPPPPPAPYVENDPDEDIYN